MGRKRAGLIRIGILGFLVLLGFILVMQERNMGSEEQAVFSWFPDYTETGYNDRIIPRLKDYRIRYLFQYVMDEDFSGDALAEFAHNLQEQGIKLYVIFDDQDMNAETFQVFLDKVLTYRDSLGIAGIVTDIEPFSKMSDASSSEKKETLSRLANFFEECADAVEGRLELLHCMPTWYDQISEKDCERIIRSGTGIILMNYHRSDMIDSISFEYSVGRQCNIQIFSAAELGAVDGKGVTSAQNTYAGEDRRTMMHELDQVVRAYPECILTYHQLRDLIKV